MVIAMPNDVGRRLEEVLAWLGTAKENLPAINDGAVSADRILAASELIDRLHRRARTLEVQELRRQDGAAAEALSRRDRAA
jgi:hypothetical protein